MNQPKYVDAINHMVQSSKTPSGEIEQMKQTDEREAGNQAELVCLVETLDEIVREIQEENTPTQVFADVAHELSRASAKFAPMNSAHEGYGVIAEEFDELWDEVKAKTANTDRSGQRDVAAMRKEAIQVAAMAIRFVMDVCDGGRGQK